MYKKHLAQGGTIQKSGTTPRPLTCRINRPPNEIPTQPQETLMIQGLSILTNRSASSIGVSKSTEITDTLIPSTKQQGTQMNDTNIPSTKSSGTQMNDTFIPSTVSTSTQMTDSLISTKASKGTEITNTLIRGADVASQNTINPPICSSSQTTDTLIRAGIFC